MCFATLRANVNFKEMRVFSSPYFCVEVKWTFTELMKNITPFYRIMRKNYDMVVHNKKQKLTDNSCDFQLLEQAYLEYKDRFINKGQSQ